MTRLANGNGRLSESEEEPIAIVGMACRFPQDGENTEKFWDMLLRGRSASTEFPESRLNIDAHYHPDGAHAGSVSTPLVEILATIT